MPISKIEPSLYHINFDIANNQLTIKEHIITSFMIKVMLLLQVKTNCLEYNITYEYNIIKYKYLTKSSIKNEMDMT